MKVNRMVQKNQKSVLPADTANLLRILETRFSDHSQRHPRLKWVNVQAALLSGASKLWSLNQMELTGGEPDVVGFDRSSGAFVFMDCVTETPKERRSLCYDRAAWEARKEHKPQSSALEMAATMGVELLTEEQYYQLQELGPFDTKTSSWLQTPAELRKLGGALFGDFRYGRTFIYHNGAESYFNVRGFRSVLRIG